MVADLFRETDEIREGDKVLVVKKVPAPIPLFMWVRGMDPWVSDGVVRGVRGVTSNGVLVGNPGETPYYFPPGALELI